MPNPKKTIPAPSSSAALTRPLSKSRFKIAMECPSKLYYQGRAREYGNDRNGDPFLRNLARGGFQVGALAKVLFEGGIEVDAKGYDEPLTQTAALLARDRVTIYEAAFRFENLFIRADIAVRDGDTLRLYEVKAGSYDPETDEFWQKRKADRLDTDWKDYLNDIAFQHFVAQRAYPHLKVVPYLCLANKRAVATVDGLNQKFLLVKDGDRERVEFDRALSARDLGAPLLKPVDVTKEVAAIQSGRANGSEPPDWPAEHTFESWVRFLADAYLNDQQVPPAIKGACKDCEFRIRKQDHPGMKSGFEECWSKALAMPAEKLANRQTILDIWKIGAPALLKDGVYFLEDLSEELLLPKTKSKDAPGLSQARRKILQWERTLKGSQEVYFDREGFAAEAAEVIWPLHFIDFETSMVAIPFNKGRRPYEQMAFQFSHHQMEKDGTITHAGQWINMERGSFPNFEFVRRLKQELDKDAGTVFRYSHHENTVLCQIREQLKNSSLAEVPDKEELIAWIQTLANPTKSSTDDWEATRPMKDLCELVLRYYWHPQMGGSNSIKVVLPSVIEASAFLQEKYSQPVYGAMGGLSSLNYKNQVWVQRAGGKIQDPYFLLPPVFDSFDRETLDRLYSDDELADGGAAMMAYARMQFTQMSDEECQRLQNALLRYCELDTLAMVMLWEAWNNPLK